MAGASWAASKRVLVVGALVGWITACGDGGGATNGDVGPARDSGSGDAATGDGGDGGRSDGSVRDQDGDGFPAGADCDDTNADINPGATEVCNELDDDCNGRVDDGPSDGTLFYADSDGDMAGSNTNTIRACTAPTGYVATNGDCDDSDPGISPTATEACNGTDDNCNGMADEDGATGSMAWYPDADLDGFGDMMMARMSCTMPVGYVALGNDCNDGDPSIRPGVPERCNGFDDNCNGTIDEPTAVDARQLYVDADGDGYGDPSMLRAACGTLPGYADNDDDCNDDATTGAATYPGATDLPDADGTDTNCDGIDGDISRSVFVAANNGTDSNSGRTRMAPVRTLAQGITIARACANPAATPPVAACTVLIADGTYDSATTHEFASGVSIYGGYRTGTWARDASIADVIIRSQSQITARADQIVDDTVIDRVTIQGTNATAAAGDETIALLVLRTPTEGRLTLRNVSIRAGNGRAGSAGGAGSVLSCSVGGGSGATAACGNSDGGGSGSPGGGALGGSAGSGGGSGSDQNCGNNTCPAVGSDGIGDGSVGGAGGNGTSSSSAGGAASMVNGSYSGSDWAPSFGGTGGNGGNGGGGGGGGSGGTKRIGSCFGCGTLNGGNGGNGGSGGCGGGGGGGGMQGGASIGVAMTGSVVTFESSSIVRGVGGNGGNGGAGASGVNGTGGSGGGGNSSSQCGAIYYYSGSGQTGGAGGQGGGGAGGGAGHGGPSIGIALAGSSRVAGTMPNFSGGGGGSPGTPGAGGRVGGTGTQAASGSPGQFGALINVQTY